MNHPYASFVAQVEKPARYLGGEFQSAHKDWQSAEVRVALAFPDIYDIGMSHLGTKILYSLLNRHPKILCERAFTPWVDMEKELRARSMKVLSLESARPLCDFDVIGISLQYELTYTNALNLLDLSGIPLFASERGDEHPLIIGGGPTATHPEPIAPFFDCFLIGEAEEVLPDLLLFFAQMKRAGIPRRERLIRLSERGAIYVPELYSLRTDEGSGLQVVDAPLDPRVPRRVLRTFVRDLNNYPFPSDTPVPYAEAIFDRASIEIARGCTEGCRFCQAGMIYRPVRERSPQSIVDSIVDSIHKGGYDESSLTSLSTADYSCIVPLVKTVMTRLRKEKVSLSVSSLRAYGLKPDLLDEMASVRATGLTFAPEAGTQRMRDVINKNITEEDISRSAEAIFTRGWSRMKLYFMIGLPTETDEDVIGIAQTGGRLRRLGKKHRPDADVTVSVSTHVPKPHTPFQWCAMDTLEEIRHKQYLLRKVAQRERIDLKWHEAKISWVEGIFSRGDRRLAAVLHHAYQNGARFDGWDDQFRWDLWQQALAACGIDPMPYLMTIPVTATLPWDHIDVGLEDGFLLSEYRKALKDRLSPPCGKPFGSMLHHTNVEEALADGRKLVCYDCGVACDMSNMRGERLVYLRSLGAETKTDGANVPVVAPAPRGKKPPLPAFDQGTGFRYRMRYTKLGRASFISHLDTMRLLVRMTRRAGVEMIYTRGFHPKPDMTFGPALGLGVASLGELCDLRIAAGEGGQPIPPAELVERLRAGAPEGLEIRDLVLVQEGALNLGRLIGRAELLIGIPKEELGKWQGDLGFPRKDRPKNEQGQEPSLFVERFHKRERKNIDVGRYLISAGPVTGEEANALLVQVGWPEDLVLLRAIVRILGDGGAKPTEVAHALLGMAPPQGTRYARLSLTSAEGLCPLSLAEECAKSPAA